MTDQFITETFQVERVQLEFLEREVEARMKNYGITLKVDGVVWDIDNIGYHGSELEIIAFTRKDQRRGKRNGKQ